MHDGVGAKLQEARSRRRLSLEEVEAATKIRVRYLRALENEEWDALPGDTYARAFVRTYANFLGLDGDRLAEDQRREQGAARPGERLPRADPAPQRQRRVRRAPRLGISPRLLTVVVSVALVLVLLAIGIFSGGGPSNSDQGSSATPQRKPGGGRGKGHKQKPKKKGHTVTIAATAEVWVCLLDGKGETLIDGQILDEGEEEGPFRSGRFTVAMGNGGATISVDGKPLDTAESSSPVGYTVTGKGKLEELAEGERPSCT